MEERCALSITRHRIDSEDRFTCVDEDWVLFARENWIDGFAESDILDRSLWDYISGEGTRYLWKIILERVRSGDFSVNLPYRCDSPGCRRYMNMEVVPVSGRAVEMLNRILRVEPREPVPLLDVCASRSERLLSVCSWCKKVRVEGAGETENVVRWLEVEDAVSVLGIFDPEFLPELSHEVCEECYDRIIRELENQAHPAPAGIGSAAGNR